MPRFIDLNEVETLEIQEADALLEEEFFNWFQIAHDFKVPRKKLTATKD